jgi:anti-anti-sigma factor
MREAMIERSAPGHEMLLAASRQHRRVGADAWVAAALARREKVLTVAAPDRPDLGAVRSGPHVAAIGPTELHRVGEPAAIRALDEGFDGLSVVVWADNLIAATSGEVHADLEAELAELCRAQPVSALCLFDRATTGSERLGAAVARHPDAVRDHVLDLRRTADTVVLGGEIDMANVDLLAAALATVTDAASDVRIDLGATAFLSVRAATVLATGTAALRERGGRVQLWNVPPHIVRILQVLHLDRLPGLDLLPGTARTRR